MIPKVYRELWKEGIESMYYLKLCGSGGGFILGFTENFEVAQDKLSDYQHVILTSKSIQQQPQKSIFIKLLALLSIVRWYNISNHS